MKISPSEDSQAEVTRRRRKECWVTEKTTVSSQQGNSSSIKMNIQMLFRKRCSRTRAGAALAVDLLSSAGHRGQWDISIPRTEVWGWFLSSSPPWENRFQFVSIAVAQEMSALNRWKGRWQHAQLEYGGGVSPSPRKPHSSPALASGQTCLPNPFSSCHGDSFPRSSGTWGPAEWSDVNTFSGVDCVAC